MLLFLLRLMSALPLRVLHALGRFVGSIVYFVPGRYHNRLRENAAQAGFTNRGFARRAAAETGAMLMELPKVWLQTEQCLRMCQNPDSDIVTQTLAENRGVLYLTPHLGCFEITARRLVQYGPITVMFRPPPIVFRASHARLARHSRPTLGTGQRARYTRICTGITPW